MKKKGFTLIELLVVVSIISLLASVILSSLSTARSKARDSKRISEIRQIQKAFELYYDKYGIYPDSSWVNSCDAAWTTVLGAALSEFIKIPVDPTNNCPSGAGVHADPSGKNYDYFASGYYPAGGRPGQWYMLFVGLENQNIPLDMANSSTDCVGNKRYAPYNEGYTIAFGGDCVK